MDLRIRNLIASFRREDLKCAKLPYIGFGAGHILEWHDEHRPPEGGKQYCVSEGLKQKNSACKEFFSG